MDLSNLLTFYSLFVLCSHSILFTFVHGSIANMICFRVLQILSSWRAGTIFGSICISHGPWIFGNLMTLNWLTWIINGQFKELKTVEMKYHEVHCNFFDIPSQRKTTPSIFDKQGTLGFGKFLSPLPYLMPFSRWEKKSEATIFESSSNFVG